MGWTNYIIVPKMKLAVEISRYTDELEEYRKEALDEAFGESSAELNEMDEVKLTDITLKDLTTLYTAYDRLQSIAGIEYDKLFLFWLEHRDIDYEIKSEYQVNLDEYKKKGYTIVRIFQREEDMEGKEFKIENKDIENKDIENKDIENKDIENKDIENKEKKLEEEVE